MAETKTKIAQELSPQELADFCQELADVPHGEMAAKILAMAEQRGIQIGRSAAYVFKTKEALPFIARLRARNEKAAQLKAYALDDDDSAQTLADFTAGELSQIAFDAVSDLDGRLDLTSKEGLEAFDVLTKSVKRLRDGDRKMLEQLKGRVKELEAGAKNVLGVAADAGASPELIEAIHRTLNFRAPPKEAGDGA